MKESKVLEKMSKDMINQQAASSGTLSRQSLNFKGPSVKKPTRKGQHIRTDITAQDYPSKGNNRLTDYKITDYKRSGIRNYFKNRTKTKRK